MAQLKVARTLLPLLARTVATACPIQFDSQALSVRLYLTITAASGSGGLQVVLRGYDIATRPSPGTNPTGYVELNTGGTAVTATGTYAYELSYNPGAPVGNIKDAVSRAVPYIWDAIVKVGDATSYTYSLSVETTA